MPITHPTDSNGLTYNAIGSAAWQGQEGIDLRAQGWTYCGFGTWGVYIAPPGGPCYTKAAAVVTQPNILPKAPEDVAAPSGGVSDTCSTCHKAAPPPPAGFVQVGGTPSQPTLVKIETKKPFPWWLIIILVLVAVSHGRDD